MIPDQDENRFANLAASIDLSWFDKKLPMLEETEGRLNQGAQEYCARKNEIDIQRKKHAWGDVAK